MLKRNVEGQGCLGKWISFCFIQNTTLLLVANVDNLGSLKKIMQILIANSFPFSFFTFRLTVVIIWKPFWIPHIIKGNFMQTIKENFKAVSEGDADLPLGASKLERSYFWSSHFQYHDLLRFWQLYKEQQREQRLVPAEVLRGQVVQEEGLQSTEWLMCHFSHFVGMPDKIE